MNAQGTNIACADSDAKFLTPPRVDVSVFDVAAFHVAMFDVTTQLSPLEASKKQHSCPSCCFLFLSLLALLEPV